MPQHDVAALADLPDGAMLAVTIEDTEVLMIRDGETVQAIGGTCPHAGALLAQGIRNGDRMVCPWHKAAKHWDQAAGSLPRWQRTGKEAEQRVSSPVILA